MCETGPGEQPASPGGILRCESSCNGMSTSSGEREIGIRVQSQLCQYPVLILLMMFAYPKYEGVSVDFSHVFGTSFLKKDSIPCFPVLVNTGIAK